MDLDEIILNAGADTDQPCLVELGHAVRAGRRTSTGFIWSSGRIAATIGPREVRLRRRLGPVGSASGIKLDARELATLLAACRDWAQRRDEWWAFYDSVSDSLGEMRWTRAPHRSASRRHSRSARRSGDWANVMGLPTVHSSAFATRRRTSRSKPSDGTRACVCSAGPISISSPGTKTSSKPWFRRRHLVTCHPQTSDHLIGRARFRLRRRPPSRMSFRRRHALYPRQPHQGPRPSPRRLAQGTPHSA